MMTSYHDDHQTPKHHQHHHYQQQSFFDELHHDMATALPDLCPRDLHTGSTDDYFRLREDGEVGGRVCAGCMVPIRDRHYLSAVGNNWHVSCLVCCECRQPLDRQSTCYVHDARIYCRDDYFASVSSHCLIQLFFFGGGVYRDKQLVIYDKIFLQIHPSTPDTIQSLQSLTNAIICVD